MAAQRAASAAASAAPSNLADTADPCCICLESLWGPTFAGQRGVADISCRHPVHSECLGQHTKREVEAAHASGEAPNGYGAFGPRGSCPLCRAPISIWVVVTDWWSWPGTWVPEIERILVELGPRDREFGGGRDWAQVYQHMVNLHCAQLSDSQLKSATEAMQRACRSEGRVPHIDENDMVHFSNGLWDLQIHDQLQRLWLYAWGPVRRAQFARRGGGPWPGPGRGRGRRQQ